LGAAAMILFLQFGLSRWVHALSDHGSGPPHVYAPEGVGQYCLFVDADAANAFAEELVMRGYLITRLEGATGSSLMALLVSSVLFAGYHVYQGWGATASIFLGGMVYGIAFLVSRRLWPVVIAHFLWNVH